MSRTIGQHVLDLIVNHSLVTCANVDPQQYDGAVLTWVGDAQEQIGEAVTQEFLAIRDAIIERLENELEQAQVQLAGCSLAALSGTDSSAVEGDYGWTVAYRDVVKLRIEFEQMVEIDKKLQAKVDLIDKVGERLQGLARCQDEVPVTMAWVMASKERPGLMFPEGEVCMPCAEREKP